MSKRSPSSAAPTPTSSAPISGGHAPAQRGQHAEHDPGDAPSGRRSASPACSARTRSSPKRRNTPATMPITIGIGTAAIARCTQPVTLSTNISNAGQIKRADDFGKREVRERRADQHRARNRPEEHQRLAVEPAEQDRDQAVDEEHAEYPGRDLGLAEPAAAADREDDRDRRGNREQPADEAVGGIDQAEVGPAGVAREVLRSVFRAARSTDQVRRVR